MAAHSKFSASAAKRWMSCPGSMVLSAGLPDSSSKYAEEGTRAHTLLEWYLKPGSPTPPFEISSDMDEAVNIALKSIKEMTAEADLVLAETRVNYANYLGVPEQDGFGTSDVIAINGTELLVGDYKHGRGVEVDAEHNEQMMLYGLGALNAYEDVADIETVRLVIFQPRIKSAPSEWSISVADLKHWGISRARSAASSVLNAEAMRPDVGDAGQWGETFLRPGEDQCRFCKAKATCPALRAAVAETVSGNVPATPEKFDVVTQPVQLLALADDPAAWLAACMAKADLIEDWLKAVRAEVERRLLAGQAVPGYKLVQGKQGNRAWADKAQAEEVLKSFRLKVEEMYDLSLISPTTAEKLAKAEVIGPRQWKKAEALITRAPGKPSVAPLSDKREALVVGPVADEFETVSNPAAAAADFV
jgi:hypothetical protein